MRRPFSFLRNPFPLLVIPGLTGDGSGNGSDDVRNSISSLMDLYDYETRILSIRNRYILYESEREKKEKYTPSIIVSRTRGTLLFGCF
jgi:hypothetical protein